MAWFVRVWWVGITMMVASTAVAEDAEAMIDRGVSLREEGRDADALALFRRAWEIAPTARARAQMALAEQALGRWVDAEAHLVEALSHADDPWIRSVRGVLEQALAAVRDHVGRLEVRTNVSGAVVRVGSRTLAAFPGDPVSLPAGEIEIAVEAPGYVGVRRAVRIVGGQLTRETVELVPVASAREEDDGRAGGGSLRIAAFAGAAVAAVGAIAGAIWWADRQSELDACREGSCANEAELGTARDAAVVTTLVAAAVAAGGLLLGLLAFDEGSPEPIACGPTGCTVRF